MESVRVLPRLRWAGIAVAGIVLQEEKEGASCVHGIFARDCAGGALSWRVGAGRLMEDLGDQQALDVSRLCPLKGAEKDCHITPLALSIVPLYC